MVQVAVRQNYRPDISRPQTEARKFAADRLSALVIACIEQRDVAACQRQQTKADDTVFDDMETIDFEPVRNCLPAHEGGGNHDPDTSDREQHDECGMLQP